MYALFSFFLLAVIFIWLFFNLVASGSVSISFLAGKSDVFLCFLLHFLVGLSLLIDPARVSFISSNLEALRRYFNTK